jgi:two-component system LytT family response regulator
MIKAIIIDDEKSGINVLEKLLYNLPNVTVLGTATSLYEGIKLLEATLPDLVFLDVHMPGENGFDLFQKTESKFFEVIITSGFDYGINAIKNEVVDYLLKPFRAEDLSSGIKKVEQKLVLKKLAKDQEELKAGRPANNLVKHLDKIGISGKNGLSFIKISDIIRCEGIINYTRILLKSQEIITCPKTLLEFEKMLSPFNFVRIHKTHLINLDHLKEFIRGNHPYVIMTDDVPVHVSRRNKQLLLDKLSLVAAG